MTKKKMITFDPDMLHLSRDQIIEVLDAIIEGWEKNTGANWFHILAAKSLRTAIRFMDPTALTAVWPRIVRAFDEINTASQMRRLGGEQGDDADFFYQTALKKIRDPKFWTE